MSEVKALEAMKGLNSRRAIWCADFNVHSTLWGGDRTYRNGLIVKDLIDSTGFVCLNVGSN